jgi:carboxypeptidase Q
VRVVLFGAEEVAQPVPPFGAFGGHSYADNHKAELPQHAAAAEADFGADRIYQVALPAGVLNTDFSRAVVRLLGPIGVLMDPEAAARSGTDVEPTVDAGVPEFVLRNDGSRYFDIHHTPDDTLDKIDRAQLDQNVAAWAALTWMAADGAVDFRAPAAPAPAAR